MTAITLPLRRILTMMITRSTKLDIFGGNLVLVC